MVDGRPPDPRQARTVADLLVQLRRLRSWAGMPSYQEIAGRISRARAGDRARQTLARSTVADYFTKPHRRRLDHDLVFEIVAALGLSGKHLDWWREAWQVVFAPPEPATLVAVNRQLPQDLAQFTGRADEIRRLIAHGSAGSAVVISAIDGMAGVGKTQLAIHTGHQLLSQGRFGDIVLYTNLRGFHPDKPPAEPAAVLAAFLRALDMPGNHIPLDETARATMYRNLVRDKNALIVLDNAASAAQVRPLLPDSPTCLVLITSRRRLADLPGAWHLELDVFSPGEAFDLLCRAAGPDRIRAEPDAAARIAELGGYLPLALALVGRQLRSRTGWSLADHAARLSGLRLEDRVRAAFTLSYRQLPADRQRILRLLTTNPGHDIDTDAAAALAGTDLDTTENELQQLLADHLLQQAAPGRYQLHDLVREYAAERARDEESHTARQAALTRLLDYYRHTVSAAMCRYMPSDRHRYPRVPPSPGPAAEFADAHQALAWLDAERANLIAAASHAADHGLTAHTADLSALLFRYLHVGAHYREAKILHTHAARLEDQAVRIRALNDLGTTSWRLGCPSEALEHYRRALTIAREIRDRAGEAHTLNNFGIISYRLGKYKAAANQYERALALFREVGDRAGQARALGNLGNVSERMGRYDPAIDYVEQALAVFRDIGDRLGEQRALGNLGNSYERLGSYEIAIEHYRQALAISRHIGGRLAEGTELVNLGNVYERLGRYDESIGHHSQALAIAGDIGDGHLEVLARNSIGQALSHAGRPAEALPHHRDALTLALHHDDRYEQARSHEGIACALDRAGDQHAANKHHRQACELYTELGTPPAHHHS
jgi:tetratricopeptide (TPR) repeat protein